MKKLIVIAIAFVGMCFASCGNKTSEAPAQDTVDTVAVDTVDTTTVDSVK